MEFQVAFHLRGQERTRMFMLSRQSPVPVIFQAVGRI